MTEVLSAEDYSLLFAFDLEAVEILSDRSGQTDRRELGFSDVLGCPEQKRLLLSGAPFTDSPDLTAARIGNWVDAGVKKARLAARPWLLTDLRIPVTLPSGRVLWGAPDEIDPEEPSATDYKTVDGLSAVRRMGPSDAQRAQRVLQYEAALQNGLITSDQGVVRNAWLDRSGNDRGVYTQQDLFLDERHWLVTVDEWLHDVEYHVKHAQQAEKTKPLPFCRDYCQFFTVCRGADSVQGEWIVGETALKVELYDEAQKTEKAATKLKESLRSELIGLTGRSATHAVVTTHINGKTPHDKLTVTAL
jgi:hypothetical protein